MAKAEPSSTILALNSGSSSLKFGLYEVGLSATEMLLSGEAEAIGGKDGGFHALDSNGNSVLSEADLFPTHEKRSSASADCLPTPTCPYPPRSDIASFTADRNSGSIA